MDTPPDIPAFQEHDPGHLIDLHEATAILGIKKSRFYADIHAELMTTAVSRASKRFARWPYRDVKAIQAAWIAGADEAEVKRLVIHLTKMRAAAWRPIAAAIAPRPKK